MVAYRPEVARAKSLPEPANYVTHTTVRLMTPPARDGALTTGVSQGIDV